MGVTYAYKLTATWWGKNSIVNFDRIVDWNYPLPKRYSILKKNKPQDFERSEQIVMIGKMKGDEQFLLNYSGALADRSIQLLINAGL